MNLTGTMRKMMGWCPNAVILNKKEEEYMVSYEGKYIDRIKGMGFKGTLGILHLVIGAMMFAADSEYMKKQDIKSSDEYLEKVIKPTMVNKFNIGEDLKYFEKVFENKDVIIYQLK